MKPTIAVIDDEERMANILAMMLGRADYEVEAFTDPEEFLKTLGERAWDLVLTDLKMPRVRGLEVLQRVKEERTEVPVIIVTAHGSVQTAIEAMQQGAFDYVEKPFDNDECLALVERALEHTRLARQNRYLRSQLQSKYALDDVVVDSEAMQAVFDLARRAARSDSTVLISGESGTGKELVARAIHFNSGRVGEPFVTVNCKSFAEGVLESELFGHEKGAFTGAETAKKGVFERADGGTLLLDEIGEVDPNFQAKLLRVLQEGELQRVGGTEPIGVDVRVVAATNRDLEAEVETGNFREDLYFRLAVIPIEIPPLRQRPADILPLARHFLTRESQQMGRSLAGWEPEVEEYLTGHDWPGNVRELENVIERAVVLAQQDRISLDDILLKSAPATGSSSQSLHDFLDEMTRRKVREALEACDGNRTKAAERLGVDRSTIYRLMERHGVD
jgi:DNA-binding NtrC family response regulator